MNEFIIEKFKVSHDAEGNEVLGEKTGEFRKTNFISLRAKDKFSLSSSTHIVSISATNTIQDYSIGVCTQKSYSKLAGYHNNVGNITNDSTYVGDGKVIVGARLTGQDESVITQGDIVVHTMKNRFNPPASGTREINSLLLGKLDITSSFSAGAATLSNILLDAPCFQASDEVLIVTYRYTYNYKETYDSIGFKDNNPALAEFTAHNLNLFNSTGTNVVIAPPDTMTVNTHSAVAQGKDLVARTNSTSQDFSLATYLSETSINNAEGFFKFKSVIDVNTLNGVLINSYSFYGKNAVNLDTSLSFFPTLAEVKLRGKTDTCVQNIYVKAKDATDPNATAPMPFYDLDNLGGSIGSISLSEDFSSGDSSYEYKAGLMELIRVEMSQAGAAGNARYKVSSKYLSSTLTGSSWESEKSNPVLGDCSSTYNFHITNDLNKTPVFADYALREMITAHMVLGLEAGELLIFNPSVNPDLYGLWVHNYDSGAEGYPFKLDGATVAGFNATDIRGVTTAEDGTIFVACAATGLWKLVRSFGEPVSNTSVARITNSGAVTDTSCHGVNFCRPNGRFNSDAKIYALFGTELCISEDGGANWSKFSTGTATPFNFTGNPDRVVGLCPNFHDSEKEVAIVMNAGALPRKFGDGSSSIGSYQLDVYFWNEAASQTAGTSQHTTKTFNVYNQRVLGVYGSCNQYFRTYLPEADRPTYKWLYSDTTSTAGLIPRICDSFRAIQVSIFDSNEYVLSYVLIDDLVNNETHIIGGAGTSNIGASNTKGYHYAIVRNTDSLTQFTHKFYGTTQNYSAITYIGRNVLLCSSRLDSGGIHVASSDVSADLKAFFMAFYDPSDTTRDYYENNPLNLWFNWTVSANGWEIDGTGNSDRLTHITSENLVRGLKASFADSSGAQGSAINFLEGEFFDIYAADGVVKDSYTEFTLNGMFFFGTSKEGTDFFPATVPVSPTSNSTIPLAVEFFKDATGDVITPCFEVDYIGQAGYQGYGDDNAFTANNFALLAPRLDNNFTIEFKVGTSIAYGVIDTAGAEATYAPQFGFTNNAANLNEAGSPFVYGINLKSGANHNQKILYVYHEGTYSQVTIDDYEPQTDIWKFVRTGQTIVILRNDVNIHQVTLTTTSLRVMYNARGSHYNVSNATGNPISIFNAKLTFDDYRLTSRIGNPTAASGSWDANFGKMHIEEYLLGIRKLFLDGVEAAILYDTETTTPNQGEIRICRGTGELVFNPADAGKVISGSWRMIPSVNVREV